MPERPESKDDENFTIDAAPSPAHGVIEPRYRGFLLRRLSDRHPKAMNISPALQLSASRMQLPCTGAAACFLDTAAADLDDDAAGSTHAACSPSPLSGCQTPEAPRQAVFADPAAPAAPWTGPVLLLPAQRGEEPAPDLIRGGAKRRMRGALRSMHQSFACPQPVTSIRCLFCSANRPGPLRLARCAASTSMLYR